MIEEINTPNFDAKISEGLSLVDFWAEWCVTCQQQHKYLQQVLEEKPDILKVFSLNVGENRYISEKLGVRNIPNLLLIKNGKEIGRLEGPQNKELILNFINKHI